MKVILQRVTQASVTVDAQCVGSINHGLLVFLGVDQSDTLDVLTARVEHMAQRMLNYRIFADDAGKMNLNLSQVQGNILLVSQFTIAADTSKGRRPSFSSTASADIAKHYYQKMIAELSESLPNLQTGIFAADMHVSLVNDGPVTFILDSPAPAS